MVSAARPSAAAPQLAEDQDNSAVAPSNDGNRALSRALKSCAQFTRLISVGTHAA
jgi:hypothetical protein